MDAIICFQYKTVQLTSKNIKVLLKSESLQKVCKLGIKKAPDISEALVYLAVWTGLEPATPCVTARY